MIATVINAIAIILGGTIGTLFGNKINEKYTKGIMTVMALVTASIGVQCAVGSQNILIMVLSLVIGTVIGIALKLDERINSSGDALKAKLSGTKLGSGKIGDAFVTSSVLFGVGTMAILGSIQAGLNKDYSILLTKSIMDFASAIAFSAALGAGVIFSAVPVFILQGTVTLLASVVQPLLTAEVITEMSAVGGAIFLGMSCNLLELRKERIRVGDMLPAIFLPVLYFPLAALLGIG